MINNKLKVALITGGTGGIGESVCEELAKRNIKVCFTYWKNREKAKKLKKKITNIGGKAETFKMNNSSLSSMRRTLNLIFKKNRKIDILINNSGISQIKDFSKINQKDWDKMININLRGPFFLSKFFLERVKNYNWCRIINISSISGLNGGKLQIHYAITKAGLISLTKSLHNIYGKNNFTINAVAPGLIKTNMIKREVYKKKKEKIKLGLIKEPHDVSKKIIQIISEKSKDKSGKIFKI